jgi:hypothetical protein
MRPFLSTNFGRFVNFKRIKTANLYMSKKSNDRNNDHHSRPATNSKKKKSEQIKME